MVRLFQHQVSGQLSYERVVFTLQNNASILRVNQQVASNMNAIYNFNIASILIQNKLFSQFIFDLRHISISVSIYANSLFKGLWGVQ